MSYTILSARYANEDHTAAVIETKESGSVAISEVDTPQAWAELAGVEVSDYVAPEIKEAHGLAEQIIADPVELKKLKSALGL